MTLQRHAQGYKQSWNVGHWPIAGASPPRHHVLGPTKPPLLAALPGAAFLSLLFLSLDLCFSLDRFFFLSCANAKAVARVHSGPQHQGAGGDCAARVVGLRRRATPAPPGARGLPWICASLTCP